jgi:hypothetical protein
MSHAAQPSWEQLPLLEKRWRGRRERFVAPSETVDVTAYTIAPIPTADARAFIIREHYSGTFVASRVNVGLMREGRIVGVATFSHPMNDAVLEKYLGTRDGCELGRFVLLDSEPFNSESFFLSRALRILRVEKPQIRSIVSFADPMERRDDVGNISKPAHYGQIYRATNARFAGRSAARRQSIAPSGAIVSPRALSKLRNGESGAAYAQAQLEAAGVSPRALHEDARRWLDRIDHEFTRRHHLGNLAFVFTL